MRNTGVTISCFWHTDETYQREELGLGEVEESEYDLRPVTFYDVAAIAPSRGKDNKFTGTLIYANGTVFRAPFKIDEVRKHLQSYTDLLVKLITED